jgi:hypothetical protein
MRFRGTVARRQLSSGSKSEHEGLVLVTDDGEHKLRRQGGNPFWDEALAPLEGKEIECEGLLRGGQIIMTRWTVLQ